MVKVPFGLSTAEVQAVSQYDSDMRLRRYLAGYANPKSPLMSEMSFVDAI
jgi:hypothetical protein